MVQTITSINDAQLENLINIMSTSPQLEKSSSAAAPDPQVKPSKQERRKFTNAYKLQFLERYDACHNVLERGALLRREGLYYSCVSTWRKQLSMANNGSNGKSNTKRSDHLLRENEQLKRKLAQAEAIIDLQKKISELLGTHILPRESIGGKL